jgi:hypothetical protein
VCRFGGFVPAAALPDAICAAAEPARARRMRAAYLRNIPTLVGRSRRYSTSPHLGIRRKPIESEQTSRAGRWGLGTDEISFWRTSVDCGCSAREVWSDDGRPPDDRRRSGHAPVDVRVSYSGCPAVSLLAGARVERSSRLLQPSAGCSGGVGGGAAGAVVVDGVGAGEGGAVETLFPVGALCVVGERLAVALR